MRNSESSNPSPSKQATFPCAMASSLCARQMRIASGPCEGGRKATGRALRRAPPVESCIHGPQAPDDRGRLHVFPKGGDEEVGAVREVAPGGRPELVVQAMQHAHDAEDYP